MNDGPPERTSVCHDAIAQRSKSCFGQDSTGKCLLSVRDSLTGPLVQSRYGFCSVMPASAAILSQSICDMSRFAVVVRTAGLQFRACADMIPGRKLAPV